MKATEKIHSLNGIRPFINSHVRALIRSDERTFGIFSQPRVSPRNLGATAPNGRSEERPFVAQFCNTPFRLLLKLESHLLDRIYSCPHRLVMTHSPNAKFISFASPKGGVGKSTSCLAIAGALLAAGERVRIIDFDQTETIWRWYSTSPAAQQLRDLTVEKGPTVDLDLFIKDLWLTATDYVLLDLAGALSDLTLMVAAFATLTITPAKVSEPDIIEANKMALSLHAVAKRINKPVNHLILLNEVPTSISNDEVDLINQIDQSNLRRFETLIHRRSAYSKSFSRGTLPHFADMPDRKALAEIDGIMTEITAVLEPKREKVAA